MKRTAFMALLLLLSSCRPTTDLLQPELDLPSTFSDRREGEILALPWWRIYGNAELAALIDTAIANNPDLAAGRARLLQLTETAAIAGVPLVPSVNLSGGAALARQPGIVDDLVTERYTLSIAAGYELDLWHRLRDRQQAAKLEQQAGREDLRTLLISTAAGVTDLYYLAVELRAQLALLDKLARAQQQTLDLVENRYRAGIAPPLDFHQARQLLATIRARRPPLAEQLARTEHALATLTGNFAGRERSGEELALPTLEASFGTGLPAGLLARRPDIRAALLRLQAQDKRAAAVAAERFPSFNLLGEYGIARIDSGAGTAGILANLAAAALAPLFDGGRRQAESARELGRRDELLAGYRKTVLQAFREVEDALAANRETAAAIDRLTEERDCAAATLRLAGESYQQGVQPFLQVLFARRALLEVESRLLAARRLHVNARTGLHRALGGAWTDGYLTAVPGEKAS
ncbi:MAG: efflux transporter outer membrane subunit [Thermodesulfobacteriota bacterium]